METRSNHVLVGSVVLILLALLALFLVWIARLGGTSKKEYDIFFNQSVDGLAVGSAVAFAGVPVGQVKDIALWKPDPKFVRVRISVKDDTPVLVGTKASVASLGFAGAVQVNLKGAVRGAPPIVCPEVNAQIACPAGVPLIPPQPGGFSAILSSAPELLERLSTLTERLSETLSDKNQASITGILENTNRLTGSLADRGPEIAATLAEARTAIKQAGHAVEQIGDLAETSNGIVRTEVRPTMANLNQAVAAAQRSIDTLNAAIGDARPGLKEFSNGTVPELTGLVRDLRRSSAALATISERVDQQGASSLIGRQRLPDYKPGKSGK